VRVRDTAAVPWRCVLVYICSKSTAFTSTWHTVILFKD